MSKPKIEVKRIEDLRKRKMFSPAIPASRSLAICLFFPAYNTFVMLGSVFLSAILASIHSASKKVLPSGWRFCVLGKTNLAFGERVKKENPPIGLFA